MPQLIDVEGYGPIEFPDDMDDDAIARAIETELIGGQQTPEPNMRGTGVGEAISNIAPYVSPGAALWSAGKEMIQSKPLAGEGEPGWGERLESAFPRAGQQIVGAHGGLEMKQGEEALQRAQEMRGQAEGIEPGPMPPRPALPAGAPPELAQRAQAMRGLTDQRQARTAEMLRGRAGQIEEAGQELTARGEQRARFSRELYNAEAERVPDDRSTWSGDAKFYVGSAVESLFGNMLPALGVGIATRSPNAALVPLAGQVYGQKYAEARHDGRSQDEASMDATVATMAEVVPERFALGEILKQGSGFGRRIFGGALSEGASEVITESVNIAYETGVLDDAMTPQEVLQALSDSFIIGALMGGGMAALGGAGGKDDLAAAPQELAAAPQEPGAAPGRSRTRQGPLVIPVPYDDTQQVDLADKLDEVFGPPQELAAAPQELGDAIDQTLVELDAARGEQPKREAPVAPLEKPEPPQPLEAELEPIAPPVELESEQKAEARTALTQRTEAGRKRLTARKLEREPVAAPTVKESDGTVANFDDARILRDEYRQGLEEMANELVKGGGISYLQDEYGRIEGRTGSENPEWFKSRGWTTDQVQGAVKKALAGGQLGTRQADMVRGILGEIASYRNQGTPEGDAIVQDAVERRRAALEARQSFAKGVAPIEGYDFADENAGEIYEEGAYDPEWDAPTRAFSEIARDAAEFDADGVEAILDRNISDQEAVHQLLQIIRENTSGEQQREGARADGRRSEVGQDLQAAQADADKGPDQRAGRGARGRAADEDAGRERDSRVDEEGATFEVLESEGPSGTEEQTDMFTAAGVPKVKAAALKASVEKEAKKKGKKSRVQLIQTGTLRTGLDTVSTPEDAASVLAGIRKDAQENMYALVTDKGGNVLSVVRHTIGHISGASVYPPSLLGAVAQVPGARDVWFAHNHPSGEARQSGADVRMAKALATHLEGTGLRARGMIVVAPGGKASFVNHKMDDSSPVKITPTRRGKGVPTVERKLRSGVGRAPTASISSPDAAKAFIQKASGGKSGVLLLDVRNRPLTFVPIPAAQMAKLRTGETSTGAAALLRAISEHNAESAITHLAGVKGSNPTPAQEKAIDNVASFFHGLGDTVRLLDTMYTSEVLEGMASYAAAQKSPQVQGVYFSRPRRKDGRLQGYRDDEAAGAREAGQRAGVGAARGSGGITAEEVGLDEAFIAGLSPEQLASPAIVRMAEAAWDNHGTNSPFFKNWFGDSKLKVRGEPLVVYHGANSLITAFDATKKSSAHRSAGLGFFFTADQEKAEHYGANVYPVYLRLENPYRLSLAEFAGFETGDQARAFAADLKTKGHDGAYYLSPKVKGEVQASYFIAFTPEQIKHASNRGTFDASDQILFSRPKWMVDVTDETASQEAFRKHGVPDGALMLRGDSELTRGKYRVEAGGNASNWSDTRDEAAAEVVSWIEWEAENKARAENLEKVKAKIAASLDRGEDPGRGLWKQMFPGLGANYRYVYQSEIAPFLREHFGFGQTIKGKLGKAAGYLRSDMGGKQPIVYFERLAEELKGKRVTGPPREMKGESGPAPTGTPVQGTLFSLANTVNTPAFKKWFSGSKVVDAEGKPLVVYHGTTSDFSSFKEGPAFFTEFADEASAYTFTGDTLRADRQRGRLKRGTGSELVGTRVPDESDLMTARERHDPGTVVNVGDDVYRLGKGRTVELLTDLVPEYPEFGGGYDGTVKVVAGNNEARWKRELAENEKVIARAYPEEAPGSVVPAYLDIKNPYRMEPFEANVLARRLGADDAKVKARIAELEAQGYDGIVTVSDEAAAFEEVREAMGGTPQQWITFRPEQVKSAVGNRGTFDAVDPSILRSAGPGFGSLSVSDVQAAIDPVVSKWSEDAASMVTVVPDAAAAERLVGQSIPRNVEGVYQGWDAPVILIAGNIKSRKHAQKVLAHEGWGHRAVLRQIEEDEGSFDPVMERMQKLERSGNKRIRAVKDEVVDRYTDEDGTYNLTPRVEAMEMLAIMAEQRQSETFPQSVWRAAREFLRKALRSIGFQARLSDVELDALLSRAYSRQLLDQGRGGIGDVLEANFSSPTPTFYSPMMRVLSEKLPGKGTGKSYLDALRAYVKKGEVKKEQVEWSGLEEWMSGQGKLTREQVLKEAGERDARVGEVVYGGGEFVDYSPDLGEIDINTSEESENVHIIMDHVSGQTYTITNPMEFERPNKSALVEIDVDEAKEMAKTTVDDWEESLWGDGTSNVWVLESRIHHIDVDGEPHTSRPVKSPEAVEKLAGKGIALYKTKPNVRLLRKPSNIFTVDDFGLEADSLSSAIDMLHGALTREREAGAAQTQGAGIMFPQNTTAGTQYLEYTTPGGTDYTELLITLPEQGEVTGNEYRSGHWDPTNILAHIRFDTRDTVDGPEADYKKTLLIDEIQSDWHQAGRKRGYHRRPRKDEIVVRRSASVRFPGWEGYVVDPADGSEGLIGASSAETEADARNELYQIFMDGPWHKSRGEVADAPFKKTWPMLAMKRAIRWAVDNGHERIAWVTGQMQAERYGMSQHISSILVRDAFTSGSIHVPFTPEYAGSRLVHLQTTAGPHRRGIQMGVKTDGTVFASDKIEFDGQKLSDVIGGDLAKEAMTIEPGPGAIIQPSDFSIGGEGHKAFYDKMLVNETNKLIKRFKSRVGKTSIEMPADDFVLQQWNHDLRMARHELATMLERSKREYDPVLPSILSAPPEEYTPQRREHHNARFAEYIERQKQEIADLEANPPATPMEEVHSFDITPQMRESALKGLPLFSKKAAGPFIDTLDADQKRALNRAIKKNPRPDTFKKLLKEHAGTPWEKQAIHGALFREALEMTIDGKVPKHNSMLDAPQNTKLKAALKNAGSAAVWAHMRANGFIGNASKPVHSVNSTYTTCTPSKACAKYCYAVTGRNFPVNVAKAELTTWAVENDPVQAAEMTAAQYQATLEFQLDKGLRLFDKGDGGMEWIPYIKRLNELNVRAHIFTKNPDFLRNVPPENLRLLSVDETSQDVADANPDLPIALVWTGSGENAWLEKQEKRFKEHNGVILPIKVGARVLDESEMTTLPKWARPWACPVDVGVKKIGPNLVRTKDGKVRLDIEKGEWNCTQCDKHGGVGCYHGQITGKVMKAIGTPVPEADVLEANLKELLDVAKQLGAGEREAISQELGSLLAKARRGIDPTSEEAGDAGNEGLGGRGEEGGRGADRDGEGPLFARPAAPGRQGLAPADPLLDRIRMKVQDKFISLRRMEEAAGPLPDAQRAYQAEELYHGRVGERLDEFEETRIRPIREDMRAAGLDMDQVGEYLHARHAPEANAYLQSINPNTPNNDALSGMSNQDAAQVLSQYHGNAEMLDIARQVDAINDERLALMVQAGLETQETVDTWKATYQHYVPLKRDVGSQQSLPARGQGFNIFRKESKRRVGSNLAVKEILTEVIAQAEATMVRAEKNRVGQALLNFAVSNPSPHLFEVDRIAKKRHVQEGWGAVVSGTNQWLPVTGRTRDSVVNKMASAGMQGDIRRRSFVSEGPDPTYQLRDNVVSVKVRGIEHHITFNEDNPVAARVARGMKNLGAEEMNGLVRAMATVNRVLSFVNTSGSPEFMISNFARDIQTAGYNLAGTDLAGLEARILANVFPSGKGIVDSLRGKNSAWAREFADFKKAGGKTGWVDHYKSVENRRAALESMLKTEKSPTRKTFKAMLDLIEATNMVVENAVRLSAFKHAKDAGMSRDQAASLAKNLTVNFNRKGEMGPAMNAAYLFFNAGMQGSVRLLQAAKRPKVQAMMAATVVLAAIMDAVNRRMVDDDEDGENPYDKIPPWVKERNFIIMNPWGDGDYLKIPLPWGYNVLHVAGQTIGSAMDPLKKGFDPVELALHFVSAGMDAFNPVGGNSPGLQMVAPTLLDPWVMWDTNQDYAGRPLRPEQAPYDVPKPDYLMHWKSARAPSKWITKTLNDLTGGDEVVPGAISVSPELLDLVWDQATGSMGRFLVDAPLATVKAIQGEEMQAHEIPFKRRLYGSKSEYWTQSTFYDALNEVRYTEKQKKHYMKDPAKLAEVKATPQYRFITQAKQARKQVRSLRKLARGVENLPLPEEEKKIRVAAYEDRMQAIMTRFLKRYRSATLN